MLHAADAGAQPPGTRRSIRQALLSPWAPVTAGVLMLLAVLLLRLHHGTGIRGAASRLRLEEEATPVPQSPVVHPELCGDADDRARAVFRWVQQRGAFVHRNLSIARFPLPGGGAVRGMAASGDIRANETLIKIPPDVVVSVAPPPPPLPPLFSPPLSRVPCRPPSP